MALTEYIVVAVWLASCGLMFLAGWLAGRLAEEKAQIMREVQEYIQADIANCFAPPPGWLDGARAMLAEVDPIVHDSAGKAVRASTLAQDRLCACKRPTEPYKQQDAPGGAV